MDERVQRGGRLIIVGGAPRSGTSMLQSMLDSHHDVFGGPEFDHLTDIVRLRQQLLASLARGRIEAFVDAATIDDAMAQLIEALLLPAADRHQVARLSEKTPMNVLVFSELMAILPAARFVHIVRDPRAVIVSMHQVAQRLDSRNQPRPDFLRTPDEMANYITACVVAGVQASEADPSRACTVRYEDLLTDTALTVKNLLDFLGLAQDAAVLRPSTQPHAAEKLLADGSDPWAGGRSRFTDPEPERLDAWRQEIDAPSAAAINAHFASVPIFASLGYQFD